MNLAPAILKGQAAQLFQTIRNPDRWIQSHRPYICPFHLLVNEVPEGSRVLDVGCGSGLWLGLLLSNQRLAHGYGFDSNAKAIQNAQKMVAALPQESKDKLTFSHLDARADWPQGNFNVVSLIDVIHHVPPKAQQAVFERAIQILPPGGRLIYKDMARRPFWSACMNRLHDMVMVREWIHYRAIQDVQSWGKQLGLRVVTEGKKRMLWYTHEWIIFEKPA